MKTDTAGLFDKMPVRRAVLTLAVPTVISQLITVVYNMADTFFIGQLNDPEQVAAATLAMPLFMLLTAFANLFGIGGASLISRSLGAGEREKAERCASFCIWTGAAASLLYGIAVVLLRGGLLPLLGADETTYDYCLHYVFWTIGVGAVPTVLNAELAHLVRGEGYARQASFGVAMGGILNIVLDPIFLFGFHMDITGAAIATMLSNLSAMLYFFSFLYRIRKHSVLSPAPGKFSLRGEIPREVLSVGLPSFVMTLMSTLSNGVLNHKIAAYSSQAVAGMGIAKKIDLLAYAIAQGMTQGALPLIGYNYSAGNQKRMEESIRTTLVYSLLVACTGALLLYFAAVPVVQCFIADKETVAFGQRFLKIFALACPTTALNFMIITTLQATGKKGLPLFLSLLRKGGLDVPLMFLFDCTLGVWGIAWATPIADWTAFVIASVLFVRGSGELLGLKNCQIGRQNERKNEHK